MSTALTSRLLLVCSLMCCMSCGGTQSLYTRDNPFDGYTTRHYLYHTRALDNPGDAGRILETARKFPEDALYSEAFYLVAAPEDVGALLHGRILEKSRLGATWISSRPAMVGSSHLPTFGFQSPDFKYGEYHQSAISIAARSTPHPEVIDLLVAAGQDIAVESGSSRGSVLYRAYSNMRLDVFTAILRHKPPPQDAWNVLENIAGDVKMPDGVSYIAAIAEAGYDLDYLPDGEYESLLPLNRAIHADNPVVVKALLEMGASPDPAGIKEFPLYSAVQRLNFRTALTLLDAGADPKRRYDNASILSCATDRFLYGMHRLLRGMDGFTPEEREAGAECLNRLAGAYPAGCEERNHARELVLRQIEMIESDLVRVVAKLENRDNYRSKYGWENDTLWVKSCREWLAFLNAVAKRM